MVDIDAIEEQHFEQFEDACEKDRVLQVLVRYIGNDSSYDGALNRAFSKLYERNSESLVDSPLDCVIRYIRKSWK